MRKNVASENIWNGKRGDDNTHDEDCIYDHWDCAIPALCDELDEARQQIADFEATTRRIMDEQCPTDEKHCGCVPYLRRVIEHQ
jgi:hypothetical protein